MYKRQVQGLWKKITAAVAMRLVVVPGIVLTLAVLLRDPLGITAEEMPTVVAIFCSPVAVTSAVMVQELSLIHIWSGPRGSAGAP